MVVTSGQAGNIPSKTKRIQCLVVVVADWAVGPVP